MGNNLPYIDLVFALSATSNNLPQTYDLMKNTIKKFIDKYGVDKTHYSFIVFGNQVIRVVNFNHTFPPNANELKAALDAQAPLSSGPILKNVLLEAFRIFNETIDRTNAMKVLVVITDKNSGANKDSLAMSVRPMEDNGVLVISVAIGDVNRSELLVISPSPPDVISVDRDVEPLTLAERIMGRILRKAKFIFKTYRSILLLTNLNHQQRWFGKLVIVKKFKSCVWLIRTLSTNNRQRRLRNRKKD